MNQKLTVYDGVLAALYLVIIIIGIIMCINHGLGATVFHMIGIAACICGVFVTKTVKYKSEIKRHIGELIFVGVMLVVSVLTVIGTIA